MIFMIFHCRILHVFKNKTAFLRSHGKPRLQFGLADQGHPCSVMQDAAF
jgi:hypothetical protein